MTLSTNFTIYGVLLVFCPLFSDPWNAPRLLILAIGAAAMWWQVMIDCYWLRATRIDQPVLLLLAALSLSLYANGVPWSGVFGQYRQWALGVVPIALYCLVAYASCHHQKPYTWQVMDSAVTAGIILSVFAIVQYFANSSIIPGAYLPAGRVISTIGSPVYLGATLAVIAPLALHRALERGQRGDSFIPVALFLTQARGAFIAAALGCGVYLFLTGRLRMRYIAMAAIMVAILCASVASKSQSDSLRLATYRAASRAVAERPLLGYGPDNFLEAFHRHHGLDWIRSVRSLGHIQDHAHNDLLQVASTIGLIGLAAYLFLLLRLFSCDYGIPLKVDSQPAALRGAIFGLWASSWFNPVPMPALAIGAILAGHLLKESPTLDIRMAAPRTYLGFGMAVALLGVVACFAFADISFESSNRAFSNQDIVGGVRWMRAAVKLNPGETMYKNTMLESLFSMARGNSNIAHQMLDEAVLLAKDALAKDQRNLLASQHLGAALLLSATHGGTIGSAGLAAKEFERQLSFAPFSHQVMSWLLQSYYHLDDHENFERIAKRYREIAFTAGANPVDLVYLIYKCRFCGRDWPHKEK